MLVYQRVALNQVTNRKVPLMIGLWMFLDVFFFFGGGMLLENVRQQNGPNKQLGNVGYWLVVLTILKNMKVNGKVDILYMKSKIIQMFKTTNQDIFSANKNKTNRKISSHQTPGIPAV